MISVSVEQSEDSCRGEYCDGNCAKRLDQRGEHARQQERGKRRDEPAADDAEHAGYSVDCRITSPGAIR